MTDPRRRTRGTTEPVGRSGPPRTIGALMGPESIATGLVAVIVLAVVAGIGTGVIQLRSDGPGAGTTARPSSSPTGSADLGSSPAAEVLPWTATGRIVLAAEARVLEIREDLRKEVASNPARADGLARSIRALNVALGTAVRALDGATESGLPAYIGGDLEAVHTAALETGTDVLGASIQNVPAYTAGATAMVTQLDGLESLVRRVAIASNLPVPTFAPAP